MPLFFQAINTFLFYVFLNQFAKVKKPLAFVFSLAWATSHICFYNAFSLTGVVDQIFILFFWISVLGFFKLAKRQNKNWFLISFLGFLGAIFSKEIFASIPIILTTAVFLWHKKLKKYLPFYWLPTVLFYVLKVYFYQPVESAYQYYFSIKLLLKNLKHFLLWFLNWRHGWQMGMPHPEGVWHQLLSIFWLAIILWVVYQAFRKHKKWLVFWLTWGLAGLAPFFFLNRVLVFYLDISLLALVGLVAKVVDNQKRGLAFGFLILIVNLCLSQNIKNQWTKHSFPAVADETAKNFYKQVIMPTNWQKYQTLCIKNISPDASWAVGNGQLVSIFVSPSPKVITSPSQSLVEKCSEKDAIIFENDGWEFLPFSNTGCCTN